MKKLVLLLMLCISTTVTAQTGTTAEEYNYAVRGFKIQRESGLDMKQGYMIGISTSYNEEFGVIEFFDLFKTNQDHVCTIVHYKGNNIDKWLCIPNQKANTQIWDAYIDSLAKLRYGSSEEQRIYLGFSKALSKFYALMRQ